MEIDISGRHFKVTEPLKEYVVSKVRKLDKYSLKVESVHVVLEVQKFHNFAEIKWNTIRKDAQTAEEALLKRRYTATFASLTCQN